MKDEDYQKGVEAVREHVDQEFKRATGLEVTSFIS